MKLMKYLLTLSMLSMVYAATGQTVSGTQFTLTHPTLGINGDPTYLYRADADGDVTRLRVNLGDEYTSEF